MNSRSRTRFCFAEFVVSPSRRLLLRRGDPVPLIPRYFDLLLLMLERRNEAVHRRDILEEVWTDVVVSDGALSQAVRVLRRSLGDDPRHPRFIATVARHGYRFIFEPVVEEPDEAVLLRVEETTARPGARSIDERFEDALASLLDPRTDEEDMREAAETLHALGTDAALRRIGGGPGHARARAYLRDSRWDVPGAGHVSILGHPEPFAVTLHMIGLRVRRAVRLAGKRWLGGVAGGAVAGLVAGMIGGVALRYGPGASPADSLLVTVPLIGMIVGALGASGVGAGLAGAEVVVRSMRGPALVLGGAVGGAVVGGVCHEVGRLTLQILFGRDLAPVMGGFEGLVMGAAIGFGYAVSTPTSEGGMATPRGRSRVLSAAVSGIAAALAAVALTKMGYRLAGTSLHYLSRVFPGSDVGLDPLMRLFHDTYPATLTRAVVSGWEGMFFGFGLVLGLTRRPR